MSPEEIIERLLQARPTDEATLADAAAEPGCVVLLLDRARGLIFSNPAEARRIARLAVEIAFRQNEGRYAAQAWRIEAQAWRAQGRHIEALDAFDFAADAARRGGDNLLVLQVQIGKIDSLGWLGRYTEAYALADRLETEMRATGAEADAAKALVNAGSLYFRRDQYARAQDCYERAEETFARIEEPLSLALVQVNRANTLTHLNRVDEALALYAQARETFLAAERERDAAIIDLNVGHLHQVSGRYSAAMAALSQGRQTYAALGMELEQANCDLALGDIYRALNLLPEARECYDRAIPVYERLGLEYEIAQTALGQAEVQAAGREIEAAFATLDRAASLLRRHRNGVQGAHVRLMRATLLRAEGRNDDAHADAEHAAKTFARHRLRGWAAEARYLIAEIAQERGQDAARMLHNVVQAASQHARGWLACRACHALGQRYAAQGQRSRALRYFREAVSALEETRAQVAPEEMHVSYLRDKQAVYESAVGALLERGRVDDIAEALELVERAKSRLLLERVQSALEGRAAPPRGDAATRERLNALRAELSRAYHRLNVLDPRDQQRLAGSGQLESVEIMTLEQAYRAALRELEQSEEVGLFTLGRVVTAETLQSALRSKETLIEYYLLEETVCAFVVTEGRLEFRSALASLSEVRDAARRLRYQLPRAGLLSEYAGRHAGQMLASTVSALQRLYDLLLRPLSDLLTTERIIVVPHGALHGLPFHAFHDGESYTLDRWEFVYAPSASFWHTSAQRRMRRSGTLDNAPVEAENLLLMGVPSPGIERVASEVAQVAKLWKDSQLFCAEEATLDAFRQNAETSRYLHLATHALFRADNPLFSGIRFADGWLLARDLYEMRLDCELATLSACHTGVTRVEPGDELFGILRGFLAAGARSVAASLWPADDAATADLMERFYALLVSGASKASALRQAQRELRERSPHPYHWAAFALVGEP